MRTRFPLPEPALSRAARWCLGGSFLLILGFFVYAGIWWPAWRVYEVTGARPRIDPPVSVMAEWDSGYEDRIVVSVDRDGRPWHRGKMLDPADLKGMLREAISRHDRKCRTEGKSSTEDIGDGVRVSKLSLALRADRAATWGAVHAVLQRAGETGICGVEFLARPPDAWQSKWLRAHLPWKGEPRAAIAIGVRRAPDGAAVYTLAGAEAPDPSALRDRLMALYRQSDESDPQQRGTCRIDAARDMPFEAVVKALDELASLGFRWVHLEADGLRAEVR